jgi:hypothetical protein
MTRTRIAVSGAMAPADKEAIPIRAEIANRCTLNFINRFSLFFRRGGNARAETFFQAIKNSQTLPAGIVFLLWIYGLKM